MRTIELNSELKTKWPDDEVQAVSKRSVSGVLTQPQRPGKSEFKVVKVDGDYWARQRAEVIANFPPDGYVYHLGYLRYLEACWKDHLPAVISPDIVWQMILCEIALVVKSSPAQFAELFTTTPGQKQEILVPTDVIDEINVDLVIETLRRCVPTNVDAFLPKFTTSTPMSQLSFNVAFADMVSPYYNYGTFMCGIPRIKVLGTPEDWGKMYAKLEELKRAFAGHGTLIKYLSRCCERVALIEVKDSSEMWSKMVNIQPCGSGSQHELSGWIMDFVMCVKPGTQMEGLPNHVGQMDWTNIESKRKFRLRAGVTRSKVVDGFLVPEFQAFSWEITAEISEAEAAVEARRTVRPTRHTFTVTPEAEPKGTPQDWKEAILTASLANAIRNAEMP